MSPELERLLSALYERNMCEPRDRPKWDATVRRLVSDLLNQSPGVSYDELMEAVQIRYQEFKRARKKPTALPPRA